MALGRLSFFEGWNIFFYVIFEFMVGVQFLDSGWEIIPQLYLQKHSLNYVEVWENKQ